MSGFDLYCCSVKDYGTVELAKRNNLIYVDVSLDLLVDALSTMVHCVGESVIEKIYVSCQMVK